MILIMQEYVYDIFPKEHAFFKEHSCKIFVKIIPTINFEVFAKMFILSVSMHKVIEHVRT